MNGISYRDLFPCLFILFFVVSCGAGKNNASRSVGFEKEVKQKIKEYTAGGWKIHGTARTLDGKLTEYYGQLEANPDLVEIIGTVNNVKSINTARLAALNSACNHYATRAANHVKGRMLSDVQLNQSIGEERDMFYAAYADYVEKTAVNMLKESFSMIRQNNSGSNDYETYFLADEKEARKVRQQALKNALEEAVPGMEYSREIENFVNEKPE